MSNDSSAAPAPTSVAFKPERTHVLAGFLMAAITLLVVGVAPLYLFWLLFFPALFIVWALRSRTTVGPEGISIRYAFRPGVSVDWENFAGVAFKGAKSLVSTTGDKEYNMPGVSFNSLPALSEASYGRIPDVLTAGMEAIDGQVSVVGPDGDQVLMTKEEYEEHLAAKKTEATAETAAPSDDTDASAR